jgi:hypothetical protein
LQQSAGKFVKAAIKHFPTTAGRRILAACDYYTPSRLVAEFAEVSGHKAQAVQIPAETFKSFLPAPVAQELLENILLLGDVGYYGGEDLGPSLALLDEKPIDWKEFVASQAAKFP